MLIPLVARTRVAFGRRVAAVGRMAFTNYLLTSVMLTTLFYGYGSSRFASLGRAALLLPVVGTWMLMLLWSAPWLDRFTYGPLEWTWRSLARGAVQPTRRKPIAKDRISFKDA